MSTDPFMLEPRQASGERWRIDRRVLGDTAVAAVIVAVELAWFSFLGLLVVALVR